MPSNKHSKIVTVPNVCHLCKIEHDDVALFGEKLKYNNISCHFSCLLFASGLSQNGGEHQELSGFLTKDVIREERRAKKLRCTFCGKKGAATGCGVGKCRKSFHVSCALREIKYPPIFQFFGSFQAFCFEHRYYQPILSRKLLKSGNECPCGEPVDTKQPSISSLYTPCCRRWMHRQCVQKFALSAGIHHCRCPFCNDKDAFSREMQHYGIYIPERDASWELEEHAFEELNEVHEECDVENCQCPNGRKYGTDYLSKWYIIRCNDCGLQATHIQCSNLARRSKISWICHVCSKVEKPKPPVLKNTPEKRKHEEDVVVIQTPKRSSPRRPVLQENRSATVNRPHSRTKPKPRPSGNRKGNEKDSSQTSILQFFKRKISY